VTPSVLGIVNITEDSFSDGGRYLAPEAAVAHALSLEDADVLDLGAASSNPDAKPVSPDVEIGRLTPVVAALKRQGRAISIDSFSTQVQLWAIAQDVDYLNDICGFANPDAYPALAASRAKLVVMHSVQEGRATRISVPPQEILGRIWHFFEARIEALERAGIARERLILDPGMGFFLGTDPQASFTVLRQLGEIKRAFSLPVLVSVSRKSFLRALIGRGAGQSGPATLAAELFAVRTGADYIRTHDPGALKDALKVAKQLDETGS
jgi:dihydropteroate synthase type 2